VTVIQHLGRPFLLMQMIEKPVLNSQTRIPQ